jgi:transketolase
VVYTQSDNFEIAGSHTLKESEEDMVTIIAAGITLFEALKAYDILQKENINIRVVDLYCVKPVDKSTLLKSVWETSAILVVEDHYVEGGLFGAVSEALAEDNDTTPIYSLAVKKHPQSGKPEELLRYEEIDAQAIVEKVRNIIDNS